MHASQRHALALIAIAQEQGVERIVVHALTDGRDTRPDAALEAILQFEATGATVGTVLRPLLRHGPRPPLGAHQARLRRDGARRRSSTAASGHEAIRLSYDAGVTDEFIEPAVIGPPGENRIRPGDAVLYWNFRPDRARQLTMALIYSCACRSAYRERRHRNFQFRHLLLRTDRSGKLFHRRLGFR